MTAATWRFYFGNGVIGLLGLACGYAFAMYVAAPAFWFLVNLRLAPPLGVTVGYWEGAYTYVAWLAVVCSACCALVWLLSATFGTGRGGDGRILWPVLLVIATAIGFAWAVLRLPPAQEGRAWAVAGITVVALLGYWTTTWLTTPAPYKFTPWGARFFRRHLF